MMALASAVELGLFVVPSVDQVGDGQHLAMKRRVQFERGVILRRAAQVQRMFTDQPFADGTLLGMLEGADGARTQRLAHSRRQHQ